MVRGLFYGHFSQIILVKLASKESLDSHPV